MVARLTPDQKVACSNHVGVRFIFFFPEVVQVFASFFLLRMKRKGSGRGGDGPVFILKRLDRDRLNF